MRGAPQSKYELGDDLPKANPWRDDLLGYAPFAAMLFNAIRRLSAPNGYVFGLHGRWGSGKSTTINFVRAYVNKHNQEIKNPDDMIEFIEFKPWIVAGHQDLMASFFKILSERFERKDGWWKNKWKRFLRTIRGPADSLVDALATLGMTIDPTKVGAGFAGAMAKKSINGMISRFLDEPSIQMAYEKLRAQLGDSKKRIVVVIDDLDRLDDSEIRSIMQMVKTVGQLPNVIYILSYDRRIVERATNAEGPQNLPRYSEKIIQQEIELPHPRKDDLLAILDREISFLLDGFERNLRWEYLVRDGVQRWINSPRDILKLSNAVKLAWPTFENELDGQDLLAMEGLKLFDPAAFSWIRDNRDFLFSEGRFVMARDAVKTSEVENLKKRFHGQDNGSQILTVLSVLFPTASKWLDSEVVGAENYDNTIKRRGVGSKEGYDTYFSWGLPKDVISKKTVETIFANLDERDVIANIFNQFIGQNTRRREPMFLQMLEELRVRFHGRNAVRPTQALLDEIFQVGDKVISIEWEPGLVFLSPRAQIRFLFREMLKLWGSAEAGKSLYIAFKDTSSVAFCATVFVDMGRDLGVFPSDFTSDALIQMEDFERLKPVLLSKIESSRDDGSLPNAPFYFDIVRAWEDLVGVDTPRSWLNALIEDSPIAMVKTARGLVSRSLGSSLVTYSMDRLPELQVYDMNKILDLARKHLDSSDITGDERNMLQSIVDGMARAEKQGAQIPG
ncbi:P-loop NTPase fold protein [Labrys sp. (in: a-proteobacteria)]|uniref:KAP family P-loop NTPase fold protein n=1 Tax=Labrys sp. (in: a-proteobacteria) TaxID=1917972 RepID=UPI0039E44531